jgi:hypothetical protein
MFYIIIKIDHNTEINKTKPPKNNSKTETDHVTSDGFRQMQKIKQDRNF